MTSCIGEGLGLSYHVGGAMNTCVPTTRGQIVQFAIPIVVVCAAVLWWHLGND